MNLLLWLLYFVLPSEGHVVHGLPLGPVETAAVCLIVWLTAHRVRIAGGGLAAAFAVAAVIAAVAVPGDRGFGARYFANATGTGAHERSPDYHDSALTRVDDALDFSPGRREFPLAFFNDHTRFNFMRMGEPDRRYLEFSAAWTGWLHVPGNGPRTYYVDAPQAAAQVSIDTQPVLIADVKGAPQTREVTLAEGWHRIHVTFSSPYGGPRAFSAGEMIEGERQPFDVDRARTERIDKRQMIVDRTFRVVKELADVVAIAWLGALSLMVVVRRVGELWQRRIPLRHAATALFLAMGTVEALAFAWPWRDRLRILTGGDDTLVYEGYARDILFNGILMNGGAPPGQGEPFYFQAAYPYFLAAAHFLFGDTVFGPVFLQRLLLAITAVMLMRVAMRLEDEWIWLTALITATAFLYWKLAPISADLLNESVYVPALVAWAWSTIELCAKPGARQALLTGLIGGVAAITRSTLTLSWPFAWLAAFVQLRRGAPRLRIMAIAIGATLAVFSLIAIRNGVVSGRFVPAPTGFSITLRGGNEPPGDLQVDPQNHRALYERLGVDGNTAQVIEFALTAPGAFLANLATKGLFVLGFYEPYAPGWGYSPVYIATWIGAVAGAWLVSRRRHGSIGATIPLVIAVTQVIALVIVYPKGERLIVPIHTLLIPYAAVAVDRVVRWATKSSSGGAEPARSAPPLLSP